ncbi:MAG: N-6 DNA methylase [Thermosipho sp. (in: Bacteria)]|nr:N-6 DNA methylase [Thermosipho sp. (in: thermotogales)]
MVSGHLFSEYFITEGIKLTDDYSKISNGEFEELFKNIKSIYIRFVTRKNPDEADTEDDFIRPVLELLGWHYSRQKSPSRDGRTNVPDFVLFTSKENKEEFDRAPPKQKPWEKGACILEAKRWGRQLDRRDTHDMFDPSIPSNKILLYLSEAKIASNGKIKWGILTNGRVWRLYYANAPSRSEAFIEIDLDEIFGVEVGKQKSIEAFIGRERRFELFKLFYLLFRKDAFIPTDWRPDKTFLDLAIEEGRLWEERVTENLKDKIFGEVFVNLAKGFVEHAKTMGEEISDEFLDNIYANTLILLYRLLFLLYAEDRNLLPMTESNYRETYSLHSIREEIANKFPNGVPSNPPLSKNAYTYWERLTSLFRMIDKGDRVLGIPQYNGELFNDDVHRFFRTYKCSDYYLVPAIDMLSRDYTTSDRRPRRINYRDLSVRHLGSIYEGLLEFKLRIAKTDLKIKKKNGKEIYVSAEDESEVIVKQGDLYLTNDKSERKATGSYYTPDYVVQYIVEKTVEPLIQKKINEFEQWIEEVKNMTDKEVIEKLREYRIEAEEPVSDKNMAMYKNLLLQMKDVAMSILDLKILDPAMGSGHFLVGVVDYLSSRLLEILGKYSDQVYFGDTPYESPLTQVLVELQEKIIENARENNYHIDEAKLTDKDLIKRLVLKKCIYGVDINPLAVELAKLSLWLHTFTVGAPLSFLDHHLKCGNSLIGAYIRDVQRKLRGTILEYIYHELRSANTKIKELVWLGDTSINEIEHSKALYNSAMHSLHKYKPLFNLYIGSYSSKYVKKCDTGKFMKRKKFLFDGLLFVVDPSKLTNNPEKLKSKKYYPLFVGIHRLAKKKRFFHWGLEFPEVRIGEENGGFDVVIGNPPYGAKFDEYEKEIINNTFKTSAQDSAAFFLERAIELCKPHGYVGMIVPKSIAFYNSWESIRNYIFENTTIKNIADVGLAFPDANYEQIILILNKAVKENATTRIDVFEPIRTPILNKRLSRELGGAIPYSFMKKKGIIIFRPISEQEMKIIEKIEQNSVLLSNANKEVFRGLYIPDSVKKKILKRTTYIEPAVVKYGSLPTGHVLFVNKVPDVERYLIKVFYEVSLRDILKHLSKNEKSAKNLMAKITSIMRHRVFFKVLRGKRLVCFPDENGNLLTTEKLVNLILHEPPYSIYFVTAVVNSKVPSWYIERTVFSDTTETSRVMDEPYMNHIPLPKIDFESGNDNILEKLKTLYLQGDYQGVLDHISMLPPMSKVLHDFLDYLAREMIKLKREQYLFDLFVNGNLEEGSNEMIYVVDSLTQKGVTSEDISNKALARQIVSRLLDKIRDEIEKTDTLISEIVYHLYNLSDDDIEIIENYFG